MSWFHELYNKQNMIRLGQIGMQEMVVETDLNVAIALKHKCKYNKHSFSADSYASECHRQ